MIDEPNPYAAIRAAVEARRAGAAPETDAAWRDRMRDDLLALMGRIDAVAIQCAETLRRLDELSRQLAAVTGRCPEPDCTVSPANECPHGYGRQMSLDYDQAPNQRLRREMIKDVARFRFIAAMGDPEAAKLKDAMTCTEIRAATIDRDTTILDAAVEKAILDDARARHDAALAACLDRIIERDR